MIPARLRSKEKAMRLLFVALVLALFSTAGQAQDVSIGRVDIVESGLYRVQQTGEIIQNENTAMGDIRPAAAHKILKLTTIVPGKKGVSFGVRFIVRRKASGTQIPAGLRMRVISSGPLRSEKLIPGPILLIMRGKPSPANGHWNSGIKERS
jgi:hypothetical protein